MNDQPGSKSPDKGFSDSDAQWYDRLTGRIAEVHESAAIQEADALRRALALEQQAQESDLQLQQRLEPEVEKAKLDELFLRLRREGLLTPQHHHWPRWSTPAIGLAVAATLAFFIVFPLQREELRVYYDEPPTMRGGLVTVERVDDHPKEAIEALATQLRTAGAQVLLYQRGAVFYADIDVAEEQLSKLTSALQAAGVEPRVGLVRVQISKR